MIPAQAEGLQGERRHYGGQDLSKPELQSWFSTSDNSLPWDFAHKGSKVDSNSCNPVVFILKPSWERDCSTHRANLLKAFGTSGNLKLIKITAQPRPTSAPWWIEVICTSFPPPDRRLVLLGELTIYSCFLEFFPDIVSGIWQKIVRFVNEQEDITHKPLTVFWSILADALTAVILALRDRDF